MPEGLGRIIRPYTMVGGLFQTDGTPWPIPVWAGDDNAIRELAQGLSVDISEILGPCSRCETPYVECGTPLCDDIGDADELCCESCEHQILGGATHA